MNYLTWLYLKINKFLVSKALKETILFMAFALSGFLDFLAILIIGFNITDPTANLRFDTVTGIFFLIAGFLVGTYSLYLMELDHIILE